jgi:hypothetical protein
LPNGSQSQKEIFSGPVHQQRLSPKDAPLADVPAQDDHDAGYLGTESEIQSRYQCATGKRDR